MAGDKSSDKVREDFSRVSVLVAKGVNIQIEKKPALVWAIDNGHAGLVRELVGAGVAVNAFYLHKSHLKRAVQSRNPEIVEILVEAGANADAGANIDTGDPLSVAVDNGDMEIIDKLIDAGININKSEALRIAADNNDVEIAGRLLDAGANVNVSKALEVAAGAGHVEMIGRLLGGEPDTGKDNVPEAAVWRRIDRKGAVALLSAIRGEQEDAFDKLIGYGANVDDEDIFLAAVRSDNPKFLRKMLAADADISKAGEAFFQAVQDVKPEMVEAMIEKGIDVRNVESHRREIPLLFLAAERGNRRIFNSLLEAGASVEGLYRYEGRKYTVPAYATLFGHSDIMLDSINAGAEINGADNIIIRAATSRRRKGAEEIKETLKALFDAGLDVNARYNGYTALMFVAGSKGHLDLCRFLVEEAGADATLVRKDEDGREKTAAGMAYEGVKTYLHAVEEQQKQRRSVSGAAPKPGFM